MSSTRWLGGSGAWTAAASWSNGVPTASEDAVFQTGSSVPYTVSGEGTAAGIAITGDQVDLSGAISTAGAAGIPYSTTDVTISGGAALTIDGTLADGGASVVGASTVSVSGPAALWRGGNLTIDAGTLRIANGGTAFDYTANLTAATVAVSGGIWENYDFAFADVAGADNVSINDQGTLIGGLTGIDGTLTVDDTAVLQAGLLSGVVVAAINPAGETSSAPVFLATPLSTASETFIGRLESAPGTSLVLTGTIALGAGGLLETGPGSVFLTATTNMGRAATTILGGSLVLAGPGSAGAAPIAFTGSGSLVIGTSGTLGVVTVNGGAGADTVYAGSGVLLAGGAGQMTLVNGSGASTVSGGNSTTVFGGAGGGIFTAGTLGDSLLIAGFGTATLQGSAAGDVLVATGSTGNLLMEGAGNETLFGGASGSNLYVGGSGSGVIVAGGGAETVQAGSGTQTIFGSTGSTVVLQQGGANLIVAGAGSETLLAGSGNATVFGGTGVDIYDVIASQQEGGSELIYNFRPGTDLISVSGFGKNAVNTLLQSQVVAGGATTLTLPDNTRLILEGAGKLTSASFT